MLTGPDLREPDAADFAAPPSVEVAGIEPASSVASTGLLRAQYAVPLLGLTNHAYKLV